MNDERLCAYIAMVKSEIMREADEWSINTDTHFSSGLRTGMRLASRILDEIYDRDFRGKNETDPVQRR